MARLAISIAGAGIGFAIGGPTGARIGWAVGSVLSNAFADPINQQGPRIADGQVTTSAYGAMLPRVWGTFPVSGNVIDASAVRETAHTTEQGGKGGPTVTSTAYTYSADLAVAIHDGDIGDLLQIRANGKLILDRTAGATVAQPDWLRYKLYKGTETQEPDPTLEAIHGAGSVPAYRGTAYIVFESFQFADFGNNFAVSFEFLVASSATESTAITVIDVTGTVGDANDGTHAIAHNLFSDLIVTSVERPASNTTPSDTRLVVAAINPYTNKPAWVYEIGDADVYRSYQQMVSGALRTGDLIDGEHAQIGIVCNKSDEPRKRRLHIFDAASGASRGRYALPDSEAMPKVVSLRPDDMQLVVLTFSFSGPQNLYFLSWTGSSLVSQLMNMPSGYVEDSPGMATDWSGTLAVALQTTGGSPAVGFTADFFLVTGSSITVTWDVVDLPADSASADAIAWDESRGCWWVYERTTLSPPRIRLHQMTAAGIAASYDWHSLYGISATVPVINGHSLLVIDDGVLYVVGIDGRLYAWNPDSGTAPQSWSLGTGDWGGVAIHRSSNRAFLTDANAEEVNSWRLSSAGNAVSLQGVVEDLATDGTALLATDVDASALAAVNVQGFGLSRPMPRAAALTMLATAYLFDLVPRDGVLSAVARGGSSAGTLTADHIGAHLAGQAPPEPWTIHRAAPEQMPRQMEVAFVDPDHNYETGLQAARRLATGVGTVARVELAVAASNDEMAQLAEILLHAAHVEAEAYETRAMPSTIGTVAPAAVFEVEANERVYTARCLRADVIDGRMLDVRAVRHAAAVYASYAIGGTVRTPGGQVVALGQTVLEVLDLPALRTQDDDAGFYLAASSYTPGWPGAQVYQSADGASFSPLLALPTGTIFGYAFNAPSANRQMWDLTSTLQVRLLSGSLASQPWAGAINAGNVAAWGAPGRWEIIGWVTAQQQGDGEWHLSALSRGLLDSLQHAGSHQAGDRFVVLSVDALRRALYSIDQIGQKLRLKAVTLGRTVDSTGSREITVGGGAMVPWAPTRRHAAKEVNGDWTITWMRQDRLRTRAFWQPSMSEASEAYEIDFLDAAGAVVATKTGITSATYTYTKAAQEADFSGLEQALIRFNVYQVSASVGRGNALTGECCAVVGLTYSYIDATDAAIDYFASTNDAGADFAFDDNTSTAWQALTLSAGRSIGCQWSSGKTIQRVGLHHVSNRTPSSIKLQYSDNGTDYTDAATMVFTVASESAMEYVDVPDNGAHTYWRLWSDGVSSSNVWEIRECELMERAL